MGKSYHVSENVRLRILRMGCGRVYASLPKNCRTTPLCPPEKSVLRHENFVDSLDAAVRETSTRTECEPKEHQSKPMSVPRPTTPSMASKQRRNGRMSVPFE
jgi:hypothetical protein